MISIEVLPLDDFVKRLRMHRSHILSFASSLQKLIDIIDDPKMPHESRREIIEVKGSFPIILYRSQSKAAIDELLNNALLFLKINYAVDSELEDRLSRLNSMGLNVMVRYFGEAPSSVVILLDDGDRK